MQKLGISNNNNYYNPQFVQKNNTSQNPSESSKPDQDTDKKNNHTVAKVALAVGVLGAAGLCLYFCKGNGAKKLEEAEALKAKEAKMSKEDEALKAKLAEDTKMFEIGNLDEKIKKLQKQSDCALNWPWKDRPSPEQADHLIAKQKELKELNEKIKELKELKKVKTSQGAKESIALEIKILQRWKTVADDVVTKVNKKDSTLLTKIDEIKAEISKFSNNHDMKNLTKEEEKRYKLLGDQRFALNSKLMLITGELGDPRNEVTTLGYLIEGLKLKQPKV